ncbi:hypothetical protein QJS04_geneDACA011784 [Acorus gramineus]|uniref:RNase H type-1 domain-containing protein n=1 Tax=Acorus gramineus TaxID=55184 RepID=A0AAV9BJ87_ACOGR|nr:hypothetical protein QJS04_geneDACA011784 [Acorus gramineus]
MCDHKGSFFEGIAVQVPKVSINILELQGILEGIRLALKHRRSKLWIEGDSSTAISWVNGRGSPSWTATRTLSAISHSLRSLTRWKASHIRHEANQLADLLAAWRVIDGEEHILADMVWDELDRALKSDAEGTMYERIR